MVLFQNLQADAAGKILRLVNIARYDLPTAYLYGKFNYKASHQYDHKVFTAKLADFSEKG